jgi:ketosteroid isomerase-like protein
MKQILMTGFLLLSIYSLSAQNDRAIEKSIQTILQKQEEAWNKHDIDGMSAYFTDDATLVN